MRIRHKGLRALAEQDRTNRVPGDLVAKLRRVLTLHDGARHPDDVAVQPGYRLHRFQRPEGASASDRHPDGPRPRRGLGSPQATRARCRQAGARKRLTIDNELCHKAAEPDGRSHPEPRPGIAR